MKSISAYWIEDIKRFFCKPLSSDINILIKRRCGTKIYGYWFITPHEAYYLIQKQEIQLYTDNKQNILEIIDSKENTSTKIDCNEFEIFKNPIFNQLNNEIRGYLNLRDQNILLRNVQKKDVSAYILGQLADKIQKKIQYLTMNKDYNCDLEFWLLYSNVSEYEQDIPKRRMIFQEFQTQTNADIFSSFNNQDFAIGLLQNNECILIDVQVSNLLK